MSTEFKTITTTFEGTVVSDRIFIVTTKTGYEDFREYMLYLNSGYCPMNEVTYSDDIDYIISMSKKDFFDLINQVLSSIDGNKFKKIPKIFSDICRPNHTYYVSPAKVGVSNQKVGFFMEKNCNNEDYAILNNNDLFNMSEHAFMSHNFVTLKIQTSQVVSDYLAQQFPGFIFQWSLMANTFVKPRDVSCFANSNIEQLWEESCKKALEVYNKLGTSHRVSRMILPPTVAYDLSITCDLMQIYNLCQTIVRTDDYILQYDDMVVILKGLRDVLQSIGHITMIGDLLVDVDTLINQYDLPF